MPTATVPRTRRSVPVLRIAMNFGKASLSDLQQALLDIGELVDLAENLLTSLDLAEVRGELQVNSAGIARRKDDWGALREGSSESRSQSNETYGMRETRWADGKREFEFRSHVSSVDLQVKYLKFRNPFEVWMALTGSGGLLSMVLMLGAFLRDFKAKARFMNAKADQEEENTRILRAKADQEEENTRRKTSESDSPENLRTLLEIQAGIRVEILSLQGMDLGPFTEAGDVVNALLNVKKLQALARLMEKLEAIEEVTGHKIPE